MTQPRLKIRPHDDHDRAEQDAPLRALAAIAAATNPVATLIAATTIITCRWATRRIRGWHILLAGTTCLAVSTPLGAWHTYWAPWRDLAAHPAAHTITQHWPTWLVGQLPAAIGLGLTTAGLYLAWRDRYTARWRQHEPRPASTRAINRAKHRLDHATPRPAATITDLALPLGINATTAQPVHLPATALRTHALVIGPTGLGKTHALQRLAWTLTASPSSHHLRIPLVVIDMKGDTGLSTWLATTARTTGRDFRLVTTDPTTSTGYNPLAGRDADDIADAIYEAVFADDPNLHLHYATLSRRLLQIASHTLIDLTNQALTRPGTGGRPWTTTLGALVDLLSPTTLRACADLVTPTLTARIDRYLADTTTSDIGDIRDRLATITDTTTGTILERPGLNMRAAIENGDIICFSLDAASHPETARTLGRLAIHDLNATFGTLTQTGWGHDHICPVILDEFSALATRKISDLFARARSAGGAIILATQDIDADLAAIGTNFAATVRTNTNVWLVLRQTRGDVADTIAHDIGTQNTWKETIQTHDTWDPLGGTHAATGQGSLRKVEEFTLHPNHLKNLPLGAAYLIIKTPTTTTLNHHTADTTIQRIHITQAPQPNQTAPQYQPRNQPTTQPKPTQKPAQQPPQEPAAQEPAPPDDY